MIEVVYEDEKQNGENAEENFFLPRNIRQIGMMNERYRIYMEDYVYTFLTKIAAGMVLEDCNAKMAVLLGETKRKDGITYIFVQGAMLMEHTDAAPDHISFSGETWEKLNEDGRRYFPHEDVIGWFFASCGLPMRASEILSNAHVRYFGGEKVLFLMDPLEQEDAFFCFENHVLEKQPGYCLYYEKNPQMQSYMIMILDRMEQNHIEQAKDEAVKTFRKIIQEKQSRSQKGTPNSFLSYVAAASLTVAVAAVSLRVYRGLQLPQAVGIRETVSTPVSNESERGDTAEDMGNNSKENTQDNIERNMEGNREDGAGSDMKNSREEGVKGSSGGINENNKEDSEETVAVAAVISSAPAKSGDGGSPDAETTPRLLATATPKPGREEYAGVTPKVTEISKEEARALLERADVTQQFSPEGGLSLETMAVPGAGKNRQKYVVKPGDSLFQISLDHYGTVDRMEEICSLNGLSEEDVIYPGQIIVLP